MKKTAFLSLCIMLTALSYQPAAAEEKDLLQEKAKPAWMEYSNPYISEYSDLSNPHRTVEEIITWSEGLISTALNFTPDDFNTRVTEMKKIFVGDGWNEYAQYLKESRMADMVRAERLNVATIINGDAMILNKGPAGGNYHWVISAPLLVTYLKPVLATGDQTPVTGGNYRVTMQIGRTDPDKGDDGIVVESWRIEPDEG